MSTLYGFSKSNVDRIGSSVRYTESSGGRPIATRSNHKNYGGGDSYKGYFKITNTSDEEGEAIITMSAGNIILGLDTIEVPSDIAEVITTCYAYLDITYDSELEEYVVAFDVSEDDNIPEQTIDIYVLPLARIVYTEASSSIVITQLHYGVPMGAGRVF